MSFTCYITVLSLSYLAKGGGFHAAHLLQGNPRWALNNTGDRFERQTGLFSACFFHYFCYVFFTLCKVNSN